MQQSLVGTIHVVHLELVHVILGVDETHTHVTGQLTGSEVALHIRCTDRFFKVKRLVPVLVFGVELHVRVTPCLDLLGRVDPEVLQCPACARIETGVGAGCWQAGAELAGCCLATHDPAAAAGVVGGAVTELQCVEHAVQIQLAVQVQVVFLILGVHDVGPTLDFVLAALAAGCAQRGIGRIVAIGEIG